MGDSAIEWTDKTWNQLDDEWRYRVPKINWVIVGGESGPGARPMHPEWVRDLRDQCVDAGVPFFFKQWGEWSLDTSLDGPSRNGALVYASGTPNDRERAIYMRRVGKKAAGRELDGRTWDEYPTT